MLPTAVLQACRLLPAAARPALTLSMRLSDELQPQHVALKLSRLRPQARLDEPALHATSGWRQLADLARALRQQRRRTGAWEGLRPTPWLTRHEDQVQQATESTAELIDAELRLLAAAALGCYCQDHSIAALYVTRAAGTAQDLDTDVCWPATTDAEGLRAFLLERQAAPTALTTEPGINVGLGLPLVAAGTQPMRRYVDLVMQRQLLAAAGAGGALLSPEALRIAVLDTHAAREAAHQVESASQRYWSLKWVEQLPPDDGVSCVVVEPRGPGYLALLAGGPAGAFAPATGGERVHVAPGQRLRLRVEQVSARRNILRLADPRPQ